MYDNFYCIDKGCDPLEYVNNEQQYSQNESVCPLNNLKCPKSKDLPQECSVLCMWKGGGKQSTLSYLKKAKELCETCRSYNDCQNLFLAGDI